MQSPQESMVLMGVEDDVIAHARRLVAANKGIKSHFRTPCACIDANTM